jgi:arsenate reductase
MAHGWFQHVEGERAHAWSAGSEPADRVNPAAFEAMTEVGIDISASTPQRGTDGLLAQTDVAVTMGCGDACPVVPGVQYEDWPLDDPAGLGVEAVRPIRDDIERRVRDLLRLGVTGR